MWSSNLEFSAFTGVVSLDTDQDQLEEVTDVVQAVQPAPRTQTLNDSSSPQRPLVVGQRGGPCAELSTHSREGALETA